MILFHCLVTVKSYDNWRVRLFLYVVSFYGYNHSFVILVGSSFEILLCKQLFSIPVAIVLLFSLMYVLVRHAFREEIFYYYYK